MAEISPLIFFKMAILSLRRHPIRSGLALLGIVIGIAAMTVTMALGEGANQRLKDEIFAMGENWIYIVPGNFLSNGEVKKTKKREKNLSYDDYLAIRRFSPDIQACTPCMETKQIVKYQDNQLVAEIQGYTADYFRLKPHDLKFGMPFSSHHDEAAIPVAVLGSDVAKELFKKENPIGRFILIGKISFVVIGVFNEIPNKINSFQNLNLNIVTPFSSIWKKMIFPDERDSIQQIIVRPFDGKNSTRLVAGIRRLLRFRHHIVDQEPDDFTIFDFQALMQAANKSSQLFNQFLLIAASVSLFVGGIGIMNIMLVAMTERRKEIGIKMALGATSNCILAQFLIESVLLCLTGGMVGIISGIAGASIFGHFTEFDWAIRQTPLVISLMATIVIGLFFGFYPAYKASKLNPIEALNSI